MLFLRQHSFISGVLLFFAASAVASAQPTFAKDVSRIFADKCQLCHQPNNIAPFSLLTYEDAQTWAPDIKRVITERVMPPWKPVEGHGEFRDSYALSDADRETIVRWVDAGAPMGDPADLPEVKTRTSEWALGDPDMVVGMSESFTPARGKDVYRCFVVSNPMDKTMYVTASDVIPGNRKIVHHVILFIDEYNQSPKLDAAEDGPGYTCFGGPGFDLTLNSMLSGWAPGTLPKHLTDGLAIAVPKGARLVMQVHYFPTVVAEDTTKIGLYFSKEDPEKLKFVRYLPVVNDRFRIPAGADNYDVNANFVVFPGLDAKAVQVFPHMHLLGRKISVDVDIPGKPAAPLMLINDWDFNWQGFYNYKDSVDLPAGSTIRLKCTFDNSANNPRNPNNPLKVVGWGEGTQDEMCVAFLGIVLNDESILRKFGLLYKFGSAPK